MGQRLAREAGDQTLRAELRAARAGERYERIFDRSRTAGDGVIIDVREDLDASEKRLFDAGYKATNDVRDWKRRRLAKLQTSKIYKREAPEKLG